MNVDRMEIFFFCNKKGSGGKTVWPGQKETMTTQQLFIEEKQIQSRKVSVLLVFFFLFDSVLYLKMSTSRRKRQETETDFFFFF